MAFDAFISYSHAADGRLAPALQHAMQRLAKPWYRTRALRVFRDESALSANPHLWSSIQSAMDESEWFVLLASPDAVASEWVNRELDHWLSTQSAERILVVVTDGTWQWEPAATSLAGTAVPLALAAAFGDEPRHVDLRWARTEHDLDLRNSRFRDVAAQLAAPIHGVAKDELEGEDIRLHRRAQRLARGGVSALTLLVVIALVATTFAFLQRNDARNQRRQARHQAALALQGRKDAEQQRALAVDRATALKELNTKLVAQQHQTELQRAAAVKNAKEAEQQRQLANDQAAAVATANSDLRTGSRKLRGATLLGEATLAAGQSQQLTNGGGETYQLGLLLAAEAVRHACASSVLTASSSPPNDRYPDEGCAQPGVSINSSVANTASLAIANSGGRSTTTRLAGPTANTLKSWSSDGSRLGIFTSAQSSRPDVVEVFNRDGSRVASATSATGLSFASALSGDGNVLALTMRGSHGSSSVASYSLSSRAQLTPSVVGRRPTLSANGEAMAWLPMPGSKFVEVRSAFSGARRVALRFAPLAVAMSVDGSLAGAVGYRGRNRYSLAPIDVATGKVGSEVDLGIFATPRSSQWSNAPRAAPDATADPPALWFGPSATLWVYNNERHVGVELHRTSTAPTARTAAISIPPFTLGSEAGSLFNLDTSTPDGRTIVFLNQLGVIPTYQVWTRSAGGWTTPGLQVLGLCAADLCDLSISPDGNELAVSANSALQIIDLGSAASTSSGVVAAPGALPHGTAVVMSPSGDSAVSWSPHSLAIVGTNDRTEHPLAVALGKTDAVHAVGFDPAGSRYVAVIGRRTSCPCRLVIFGASTGQLVRSVSLGASPLDRIAGETPVGVALADAGDVAAVSFDSNPAGAWSASHRGGLATYSVETGRPLHAVENPTLGLGEHGFSVPAFQPGTGAVALTATSGTFELRGVLVDARNGTVIHTFVMSPGVATIGDTAEVGVRALRFSPNGRLLAANTGGNVVFWDVGSAPASGPVPSDAALTSNSFFDPAALAISDGGDVATVGLNSYVSSSLQGNEVVMTGDKQGGVLSAMGMARLSGSVQQDQMSVAMPPSGGIVSVAVDVTHPGFFTDVYSAAPDVLLNRLCEASSRAMTSTEWRTYFPGEPYAPACSPHPAAATSWDLDASLGGRP